MAFFTKIHKVLTGDAILNNASRVVPTWKVWIALPCHSRVLVNDLVFWWYGCGRALYSFILSGISQMTFTRCSRTRLCDKLTLTKPSHSSYSLSFSSTEYRHLSGDRDTIETFSNSRWSMRKIPVHMPSLFHCPTQLKWRHGRIEIIHNLFACNSIILVGHVVTKCVVVGSGAATLGFDLCRFVKANLSITTLSNKSCTNSAFSTKSVLPFRVF